MYAFLTQRYSELMVRWGKGKGKWMWGERIKKTSSRLVASAFPLRASVKSAFTSCDVHRRSERRNLRFWSRASKLRVRLRHSLTYSSTLMAVRSVTFRLFVRGIHSPPPPHSGGGGTRAFIGRTAQLRCCFHHQQFIISIAAHGFHFGAKGCPSLSYIRLSLYICRVWRVHADALTSR